MRAFLTLPDGRTWREMETLADSVAVSALSGMPGLRSFYERDREVHPTVAYYALFSPCGDRVDAVARGSDLKTLTSNAAGVIALRLGPADRSAKHSGAVKALAGYLGSPHPDRPDGASAIPTP